jgi:hypothetical protein
MITTTEIMKTGIMIRNASVNTEALSADDAKNITQ